MALDWTSGLGVDLELTDGRSANCAGERVCLHVLWFRQKTSNQIFSVNDGPNWISSFAENV